MKHELNVKFDSISEVKDFVDIISSFSFDIDLVSGRYVIDAKSIMGIFSLDLSKEIVMVAYTEDISKLKESVKDFIK
ncbi:MAG: HPr family phosphocarrier protein [Clostridia bacterium]|nr:HPr family phosphocarrier protein [Clostridia bacterium]